MKWLLMAISEALEWKMSSTKEGLFNFLFTSLFHPCTKRGQWFFTCPECFQPNGTVRNWGLPGTNWSREEKRGHNRIQTGKGTVAALAVQYLRYKYLWVPMSCCPKARVWQMTTDKLILSLVCAHSECECAFSCIYWLQRMQHTNIPRQKWELWLNSTKVFVDLNSSKIIK